MAKKSKASVAAAMNIPVYKPTIEVDEKMYPGVKDLKIDQEVSLTLKVKVTSIQRDRWNKGKLSVRGEIQNAEPDEPETMNEDY